MNLVIIETGNKAGIKSEDKKNSKSMIKIKAEYLIERLIRIGKVNGITRVFCISIRREPELENLFSTKSLGIPTKLIVSNRETPMHILFALASIHKKEPFFLTKTNSVFLENEFSEFVTYSFLNEDADGSLAVTKHINDEKPLGVAMNDEDIILKFNNSREGYNWFNGGIYFFTPQILNETKYAFLAGISGIEKFLQFLIDRKYILKGFSFSKIIEVENSVDATKAEELIRGNE